MRSILSSSSARQDGRLGAIVDPLITEQIGAARIVTLDENAHPARRKRQDLCRLIEVVAPRQQPKRVQMALRDRLGCGLVAMLQLCARKMRFDGGHDRTPSGES